MGSVAISAVIKLSGRAALKLLPRAFVSGALLGIFIATAAAQDGTLKGSWPTANTSLSPSVFSSPAIEASDGTIVVGVSYANGYGTVLGLTPTGTAKWQLSSSSPAASFEASATLGSDGTVYIGSTDGVFYAIDPSTGHAIWTYDFNTIVPKDPKTGLPLSAIISSTAALSADGQTIYVGVGTLPLTAGSDPIAGALCALTTNGRLAWSKWFPGNVEPSSPAVGDDGTIYVGCWDHNLHAINPDGSDKWAYALNGQIFSSVAIGGDGTLYIGSIANQFVALNLNGQLKWQRNLTLVGSPAIGADGTIYLGNYADFTLTALDWRTGSTKWTAVGTPYLGGTPTIRADGTILYGDNAGVIRAYDPAHGTVKWSYATGDSIASAPAIAPSSDHSIYVSSLDGRVYAFTGNDATLSAYSSWPTFQHDMSRTGRSNQLATGGRMLNLSTRGSVSANESLIVGFALSGAGAHRNLLVRGVGPTLSLYTIANPLSDPKLAVYLNNQPQATIALNNDWGDNDNVPAIMSTSAAVGAFPLPSGSKDAAVLTEFASGVIYSEVISPQSGPAGIALGEVYDAEPNASDSQLINLSSRGHVGTGDDVLIGGLVIGGPGRQRVLVRAVGPGLAQFGVNGVLSHPLLTVRDSNSQVVATNSDWTSGGTQGDVQNAGTLAGAGFALSPGDAAAILGLSPGAYTIVISGSDGGTGEALVEIYALPF